MIKRIRLKYNKTPGLTEIYNAETGERLTNITNYKLTEDFTGNTALLTMAVDVEEMIGEITIGAPEEIS